MSADPANSRFPPNLREGASLLSRLTFWWLHPLLLKGFKGSLELNDICQVQEKDSSKRLGELLCQNWKKDLKRSKTPNGSASYIRVLIRTFGFQYMICGLLGFVEECICRVAQPLFIIGIIRYHGDDLPAHKRIGLISCVMITVMSVLHILTYHPFNFKCRHLVIQIKAATGAAIFRKMLRLNAVSMKAATVSELVNLLSTDLNKFDASISFLHYLWIGPLQTLITTAILWHLLGPSCLAGVLLILLFGPLQFWIGRNLSRIRALTTQLTASRVSLVDEVVKAIRGIKMYAWELPFIRRIETARKSEIDMILQANYFRSFDITLAMTSSKLIVFLALLVYVLTGNVLTAEKVFVTSSLINNIRLGMTTFFPLAISKGSETLVTCRKIQKFLELEEIASAKDFNQNSSAQSLSEKCFVEVVNVRAKWDAAAPKDVLVGVSFSVQQGQVMGITGGVGAGKSSLLLALLKELPLQDGRITVKGRTSYASQEPWLFPGTVRNNIIFGQPFKPKRYDEVIRVCALEDDLRWFPKSDQTMVGERGFCLSGGQKARINLARAMYFEADIYLLDDPLSAVDVRIGNHIFVECINSFLKKKVTILVTHQMQFLRSTSHNVVLNNGQVEADGQLQQAVTTNINSDEVFEEDESPMNSELSQTTSTSLYSSPLSSSPGCASHEAANGSASTDERRKLDSQTIQDFGVAPTLENNGFEIQKDNKKKSKTKSETGAEEKFSGAVGCGVYMKYLSAGGKSLVVLLLFFSTVTQIIFSFSDYFLSLWTNKEEMLGVFPSGEEITVHQHTANQSVVRSLIVESTHRTDFIWIYSGLTLAVIASSLCRTVLFFHISRRASKSIHSSMVTTVLRAPVSFFEVRPIGQILNRFTKEMGQVDDVIPETMNNFLIFVFNFFGIIAIILYLDLWILLPTAILYMIFLALRSFYLSSSRDLKRLERISKSPVFTEISSTLNGLASIRAFGGEACVTDQFDGFQNVHTSASYLFLCSARIFGACLDVLSTVYIAIISFNFMFKTDILGGEIGLGISMAMMLSGLFQWGVRQSAEIENQMTSVESVLEYSKLKPEEDTSVANVSKKEKWPLFGKIVFENVHLRYGPSDPLALQDINFTIKPKEKVGIVGRTGAGKSSLLGCMCRLVSPQGKIFIDGVATDTLPLADLRAVLSVIPQDPVLISGTLRENLDPFSKVDDQTLWKAIEEVQLKQALGQTNRSLDLQIGAGGSNLSLGQRQLVCLARAILSHNKILILDEATASVDPKTDNLIQTVIREKFSKCTVITIAHRLHTVIDCDRIMVMQAGKVVEFDPPTKLLRDPNSALSELIKQMGPETELHLKTFAKERHQQPLQTQAPRQQTASNMQLAVITPNENESTQF